MEEIISIFTESSESKGILYASYKFLNKRIARFLNDIEFSVKNIKRGEFDPTSGLRDSISSFKKDINVEYRPVPIDQGNIPAMKELITAFKKESEKLLKKYASLRYTMSYGGSYIHGVIKGHKVYNHSNDPARYELMNKNLRDADRALDWAEKILIDLFNMIDQDLNLLTIVNLTYIKKRIFESTELDKLFTEGVCVSHDDVEVLTEADQSLYQIDENRKFIYSVIMEHTGINLFQQDDMDEVFEERSRSSLKESYRKGINKKNGHIITVIFDLNPEDVVMIGSHDDTNPVSEEEGEEIRKNIRKTGYPDFISAATVKDIIDDDTKEHLKEVSMVGIMNGNLEWARKSLKEREEDIQKGAFFGGGNTFRVGEKEKLSRRGYGGTYKTTKFPKSVNDLSTKHDGKFLKGKDLLKYGRGYIKESKMSNEALVFSQANIGNTPEELYKWMHENIAYDDTITDWKLRTPSEVYTDKKGNCHDQSLFECLLLNSMNIVNGQIFFVEYKKDSPIGGNTHTLTWYREGGPGYSDFKEPVGDETYTGPYKYYWIENAWEDQAGIHGPYNSIDELKNDIINIYNNDDDINSHEYDGIVFGKNSKARCGMSLGEYVESWELEDDHEFTKNKTIEESLEWIERFTHDETFREEAMVKGQDVHEFTEAFDPSTLPDKLYFGTPGRVTGKTIGVINPRGLFLTPHIGIASLFVIDRHKEAKKYFNDILAKNNRVMYRNSYNIEYEEWKKNSGIDIDHPIRTAHLYHNIPEFKEVKSASSTGFIYQVDVSNVKNDLEMYVTQDADREVVYKGSEQLPITGVVRHTINWSITYRDNGSKGTFETKVMKESTDPILESISEDKNGTNRKKLYQAFAEWAKEHNSRNTFGNISDWKAFTEKNPFVPYEMRYFYRISNPLLCVLAGDLVFFQVSELETINSENDKFPELLIFAATEEDMRVFNTKDKKIYRAVEENGFLKLKEILGSTFDNYLQDMIQMGDILNGVDA